MPRICCVDGCNSREGSQLSLFRCPKDESRCHLWKQALGFVNTHRYAKLTPEQFNNKLRVCQLHFPPESFIQNNVRTNLQYNTAPSMNLLKNTEVTTSKEVATQTNIEEVGTSITNGSIPTKDLGITDVNNQPIISENIPPRDSTETEKTHSDAIKECIETFEAHEKIMHEVNPANIYVKSEPLLLSEPPPLLYFEEECKIKLGPLVSEPALKSESLMIKSEHEYSNSEIDFSDSSIYLSDPSTAISKSPAKINSEECTCIVCDVSKYGFSERPFPEKCSIINNGRPTPKMKLDKKTGFTRQASIRPFNMSFFKKYVWLTGCATKSKLFCWPCLLFIRQKHAPKSDLWTNGFTDMNNFYQGVKRHRRTKLHFTAIIEEKIFCFHSTTSSLNRPLTFDQENHNELVSNNRNTMARLIDIASYFGQHKSRSSEKQEAQDYLGSLELLSKCDETFQHLIGDWMSILKESAQVFYRDLQISISRVALNRIKNEITESRSFVTIILSEATYVKRNNESIAVIVRYLKPNGDLHERFIGFRDVANRKSSALYKTICNVVKLFNCESKLVAVSYDGAAILTEEFKDLNKMLKDKFGSVNFVHYHAHKVNFILYQSVKTIYECNCFFFSLNELGNYLKKLSRLLEVKFPEVKKECWEFDGPLVGTVCVHRDRLIALFREILDQKQFDFETINSARGYLQLFQHDFSFRFWLILFSEIYHSCEILLSGLNSPDPCEEQIQYFVNFLYKTKDCFGKFYSVGEHNTKKDIGRADFWNSHIGHYQELFHQVLNALLSQVTTRFDTLQNLCTFDKNVQTIFSEEAFLSKYGNLFDLDALRSQLVVIFETPKVTKKSSPSELLICLNETGLSQGFQEVAKLCELILTLPITNALVVGHPVLERIKSYVENSESHESDFSIFYIENDYIKELSQTPTFYDEAIDEFAKINQKFDLKFKSS